MHIYTQGKPVLVVNGAYRGSRAVLEELDVDNYCVSVKITHVSMSIDLIDYVPGIGNGIM